MQELETLARALFLIVVCWGCIMYGQMIGYRKGRAKK